LFSHRSEAQRTEAYASPLRSLRTRWTAILSILLEGLHAVSVTHAYRITLTLRVTKKEIVLLDIGSHDEMYR
jgi:hypothetical protein